MSHYRSTDRLNTRGRSSAAVRAVTPSVGPRRRRRDGYALLIVMIVILAATGLAAVHQRQLNAALRVEQARIESEEFARGPLTVLAIAIDRLKTGDPPVPVDYRYWHTSGVTTTLYRVRYSTAGTQWTVTADPDPSAGGLPALPGSF